MTQKLYRYIWTSKNDHRNTFATKEQADEALAHAAERGWDDWCIEEIDIKDATTFDLHRAGLWHIDKGEICKFCQRCRCQECRPIHSSGCPTGIIDAFVEEGAKRDLIVSVTEDPEQTSIIGTIQQKAVPE